MVKTTDRTKGGMTIKCSFEKILNMPPRCVSCSKSIGDGVFEVAAFTTLHASKATFKFPVCDDCLRAKQQHVDLVWILIISSVAFLLSIFTLFGQPGYLHIPHALYLIGGFLWLAILATWMVGSVLWARKRNTPELMARRANLRAAVKPSKLVPPRGPLSGEITFRFTNLAFAREFKKLNKGNMLRR
jgi:hypothetical protein